MTRDDSAKTIAVYLPAAAADWDLAIARRLRHQLQSWEAAGHQVQLHLPESTFAALPSDQRDALTRLAFSGVQICLYTALPDLGALVLNITIHGPTGSSAWASDNLGLQAPDHNWDMAAAGARIVRGQPPVLQAVRMLDAKELMPAATPGLIKVEIANELDGAIDSFARRFWEHLRNAAGNLLNDALTGKDSITQLTYSDRYVCNPLVVNLLVCVIHELARHNDSVFDIRIQGRQYQRDDHRSPWQCHHDWRDSRERDDALRAALEYCGLNGEVLSLPSLPHHRQLQLKFRSGKQLTIQFDQGLSFWEADRTMKTYLLKFDFAAGQPGQEIIDRIHCRVCAPNDDCTQIFIFLDQ